MDLVAQRWRRLYTTQPSSSSYELSLVFFCELGRQFRCRVCSIVVGSLSTRSRNRSLTRHKLITFVVLIGFCIASLPLPVGTVSNAELFQSGSTSGSSSQQPYPCQHSLCGCKSAEQCWTNCCCNTPLQRRAWALKHGVTPPAYAILGSEDSKPNTTVAKAASNNKASDGAVKSCCQQKAGKSTPVVISSQAKAVSATCCKTNTTSQSTTAIAATKSCCSKPTTVVSQQSNDLSNASKSSTETKQAGKRMVLSLFALQCQGRSTSFTLLPWTILVKPAPLCLYAHELSWIISVDAIDPASIFYAPATPPPKLNRQEFQVV